MVQIGKLNTLKVTDKSDHGFYVDGLEDGPILIPRGLEPQGCQVGDEVQVFVCYDSEDRLMATTEKPLAMVGNIAKLEVVSVTQVGAFLNWGLGKDLLLPFREQTRELKPGQHVVVAVYLDNTGRIASSMRVEKYLVQDDASYKEGEQVNLLIFAKSDMGYKAIVNGKHLGLLYANEVFAPLRYAQETKGYIKKQRPDGKIDLILQALGYQGNDELEQKILSELKGEDGFLPITDKTSSEIIYDMFGVSKKKYKMALGGLYKKRLITIEDDGIRLVK